LFFQGLDDGCREEALEPAPVERKDLDDLILTEYLLGTALLMIRD
jgi:hypothetical protein